MTLPPKAKSVPAEPSGAGTSLAVAEIAGLPAECPSTGPEAELQSLLVSINIGLVVLDRGSRIRRFTPEATALFSFLPSDIGRPIGDLSPKFTDPLFLPDVHGVLETAESVRREIHAHDGRLYVRQTLPYRLADGSVEGVVVTFTDAQSDSLQDARLYAMSIVNTVRDPLIVVDAGMQVHSINQPFSEYFQVAANEVIGRPLAEVCAGLWNDGELLRRLPEVLENGRPIDVFQVSYASPTGRRTLLLNARALHSGDRRADLILLAVDDVTEQRRVEALLAEAETRQAREDHSRQRRIDLSNSLRISTVGELATGLAHALNQPLASIANVVEACTRYVQSGTVDRAKLLELLASISSESLRAADIVAHLRSFVDKGVPQMETVDLVELARLVPVLLAYDLERARIEVRLDLPDTPLAVRADSIQIEQVLVNLLQNAIDSLREASPPRRVIELSVRASRRQAEVSVRDNGTGVPATSVDRMFEPFFTTKQHGLGMGLALSRSVLEAHRGRIWIEAPADGSAGAIAKFTIPLKSTRPRRRDLRA